MISPLVDADRLPAHVAIIMDGNGRWARSRDQERPEGHKQGSDAVRRIVRGCRRLGIPALTLFAFSEQNWSRPEFEVEALMRLLREFLISEREELIDKEIRIRGIGRIEKLPDDVRAVLEPLEAETRHLDKMTLSLALSYGGREEIVDAMRRLARDVATGALSADAIDERSISAHVASFDVGPVDLLIRTGGELRISNFLLWGSAYAELHFSPVLWPDFQAEDLYAAIAAFQGRERRFGKIASDVEVCVQPNGERLLV